MSSTAAASPSATGPAPAAETLATLRLIEKRVQWLSAWTIHHANHIRPSRDGLKVGGHQASSASMTAIMTALYFHALRPQDRVAVKPHASPVYHAIQYLLGRQARDQLERFRSLGGAQSYPSRTKDHDDVDFSTGSVGLGVAITAFAAIAQDYVRAKGWLPEAERGRMISILGDAELDEGNIYECLLEGVRHALRDTWWIVDFNRQSLDATTVEAQDARFTAIFEACGWEVIDVRFGARLRAALAASGGAALERWFRTVPNDVYSALVYRGGAAWRERLTADLAGDNAALDLIGGHDDTALHALMTDLGGHCLETLIDAFDAAARSETPKFILVHTIKGHGLPFAGHKDNHAGLMSPPQMAAWQQAMGVPEGAEWELFAGLAAGERQRVEQLLAENPFHRAPSRVRAAEPVPVPPLAEWPVMAAEKDSTQAAFGKVMFDLARGTTPLASRIVTTAPDVTVSTNLGPWVNRRNLFARETRTDIFADAKIVSAQRWTAVPAGQHLELGIAEHNLFLALAAFGMTHDLFGTRLLPVGTLYDPFIARGLDALNYACYQDARFLLVAMPSGLTLAPEGGAHQSIGTPVIGMAQPGLTTFEPSYADEVAALLNWAFGHMQADDGGSVYLRLSTRQIAQPRRTMNEALAADIVSGGYWLKAPAAGAELALAVTGAMVPEALEAFDALAEDVPGLGLLAVPSADRLYADWSVRGPQSRIAGLLSVLAPDARLVTLQDGAPQGLAWLGAVRGQKVRALGLTRFGQSGDLPDLYRTYGLDAEAIIDAAAAALLA